MTEEKIIFQEITERMTMLMEIMKDNFDELEKLLIQLIEHKK